MRPDPRCVLLCGPYVTMENLGRFLSTSVIPGNVGYFEFGLS